MFDMWIVFGTVLGMGLCWVVWIGNSTSMVRFVCNFGVTWNFQRGGWASMCVNGINRDRGWELRGWGWAERRWDGMRVWGEQYILSKSAKRLTSFRNSQNMFLQWEGNPENRLFNISLYFSFYFWISYLQSNSQPLQLGLFKLSTLVKICFNPS